ncbi:MAG: hypothetical protein L0Z50_10745, partial [Verrucomicrobiales bacterium]|nr:hypothetical protein [Verrucomicrobiales bacterium]
STRPASAINPDVVGCRGAGRHGQAESFCGDCARSQLEKLSKVALRLGNWLLVFIVAAFAAYIGIKYFRWRFFIRSLRMARITPEVLKQKLDGGEDVFIVDLRGPVDFETEPRMLPRAIHLTLEEMEQRH